MDTYAPFSFIYYNIESLKGQGLHFFQGQTYICASNAFAVTALKVTLLHSLLSMLIYVLFTQHGKCLK